MIRQSAASASPIPNRKEFVGNSSGSRKARNCIFGNNSSENGITSTGSGRFSSLAAKAPPVA